MALPILLAALLTAPAPAGQTWTVDDDGPADFPEIQLAIDAASDGDVVLVQPGSYGSFVLTKALTVLGPGAGPRPSVGGESVVASPARFTLGGLYLNELIVVGVAGRGRIDDCEVSKGGLLEYGLTGVTFRVEDCAEIEISRTRAIGKADTAGLEIRSSNVAVVDSDVRGGLGADYGRVSAGPGETGIRIENGSTVLVAGSSVRGGDGGPCIPFGGYSDAGHGILVGDEASSVVVRGSSTDMIAAGKECGLGQKGKAILGIGTVVVSGVAVFGGYPPGMPVIEPAVAEPYLEVGGDSAPGQPRRIRFFAAAGAPAVVAIATSDAFLSVPGLEGLVWIDPTHVAALIPMVGAGQDEAVTHLIPVPADPQLSGLSVGLQAGLPQASGAIFLTNPANVVVRF